MRYVEHAERHQGIPAYYIQLIYDSGNFITGVTGGGTGREGKKNTRVGLDKKRATKGLEPGGGWVE